MNNIFNIQRFTWLFIKHTKENYKTNLLSVAVLLGIMFIGLGFAAYVNHGEVSPMIQNILFWLSLLFTGTVFTSMVYAELGSKKKSIPLLTLPVSHFERFLVGWIYSFVIFQLIFVVCFFTIDLLVLHIGDSNTEVHNKLLSLTEAPTNTYQAFIAFTLLHAVSLIGAIYFDKKHFIKIAFAFFLFMISLSLINYGLIKSMFQTDVRAVLPFSQFNIREGDFFYKLEPSQFAQHIFLGLTFAVVILLWTATYYKLKEKQV